MLTDELIKIFGLALRHLREYEDIVEKFDEVISARISATKEVISFSQFAKLMQVVADYNQECQVGKEVTMQLIALEGEDFTRDNLLFFDKDQLVAVIAGYCTSGVMG